MTPHQKIMRAFRRQKGLRLNATEVRELAIDDAISTRAANDDETDAEEKEASKEALRLLPP